MIAGSISRKDPVSTEGTFDDASFQTIKILQPPPEVDLFATYVNHRLPMYVSPVRDPRLIAVDAFLQDWNKWKTVYLFPPRK